MGFEEFIEVFLYIVRKFILLILMVRYRDILPDQPLVEQHRQTDTSCTRMRCFGSAQIIRQRIVICKKRLVAMSLPINDCRISLRQFHIIRFQFDIIFGPRRYAFSEKRRHCLEEGGKNDDREEGDVEKS